MSGFDRLGSLVEGTLGAPPASRLEEQRRRFLAHTAVPVVTSSRRWSPWLLVAAGVAVVLTAGGVAEMVRSKSPEAPVASARVEAPEPYDRWLEGGRDTGNVELIKGAVVVLSREARCRAQGLRGAAPRVTLEGGRVEADLTPVPGRRWTFLAGAYQIVVLGTAFSIDYDPASGALDVGVRRGRVRVGGGELGANGITLDAGQTFRAEGKSVTFGAEPPLPSSSAVVRDEGPKPSVVRPAQAAAPQWRAAFENGDYASALAAAELEGFESLVGRLGPSELSDLADSARLSGSSSRARQALLSLRGRFVGTQSASRAAFLLGRMEGSPRWFETYLQEQPQGPYAAEAAGRLVVAYRDHGDPGRAQTAAERYLAQYPTGPYADLAHSLLGRPRSGR